MKDDDGRRRCASTDDDVGCCMENVRPGELVPAACTSLRCLAHDLQHASPDLESAKAALVKHDRHLYLLGALVAAALLWAVLRRRPRRHPRFPLHTWQCDGCT